MKHGIIKSMKGRWGYKKRILSDSVFRRVIYFVTYQPKPITISLIKGNMTAIYDGK